MTGLAYGPTPDPRDPTLKVGWMHRFHIRTGPTDDPFANAGVVIDEARPPKIDRLTHRVVPGKLTVAFRRLDGTWPEPPGFPGAYFQTAFAFRGDDDTIWIVHAPRVRADGIFWRPEPVDPDSPRAAFYTITMGLTPGDVLARWHRLRAGHLNAFGDTP